MRNSSVIKRVLGVQGTMIEGLEFEGNDLIVAVRLHKRQQTAFQSLRPEMPAA